MSEPTGRAVLIVQRDGEAPRRFVLGPDPFRIGRAGGSELAVPEGHISKQHAQVQLEADGFVLSDVGSRAGVLVNGLVVQRHVLAAGDVVELGLASPVRIEFQPVAATGQGALETTLTNHRDGSDPSGMGRLARFFEFSRKLGRGFAIEEVLQDVVDLAIDLTRAERGMLIFRRPDGSLDKQVARTRDGRTLPAERVRVSETLVQQAFEKGRASVVADVSQQAELAIAESIQMLELRSAVTLPLLRFVAGPGNQTATSEVFGLLYLDSRSLRGGFDGLDMNLLERLAQDASSVIENARLLRETEEKKRIDRELVMAREVQAALLPEQFVSTRTFAIAGTCVPCHDLGGDYVDQFELGNGRQVLIVADVCGKGIAASLLAATLQGALAAEIAASRPLGELVGRLNRVQCRVAPIGKFITMVLIVLHPDGAVDLVNAGHCPVLHARQNGVAVIDSAGMALGLDPAAAYREYRITLQPGDVLLSCTDGVLECEGPGRELFGDARLADVLAQARLLPAGDVLDRVLAAVDAFRGEQPVSDDLSLLVVRREA